MNGWVFRQELLKHPALRDIPTIAISGQVAPGASEYLSVAGTLCKPFEVAELLQLVGHCLLAPDPA
jgi:CheY-like chemotaxis protein